MNANDLMRLSHESFLNEIDANQMQFDKQDEQKKFNVSRNCG
jgi:hypothetical protein